MIDQAAPMEPAPVEAAPAEPALAEPVPVEALSAEPAPVEPSPADTVPVEALSAEPVPVEPSPVEGTPAEETLTETLPVEPPTEPVEPAPANPISTAQVPVELAHTESSQAVPEKNSMSTAGTGSKWNVDMSYIDYRTADPDRLEIRQSSTDASEVAKSDSAALGPSLPSSTVKKDADGKWSVNTSYIDHRTMDPNRLEPRRDTADQTEEIAPSASVKKADGKWIVDTSYIDSRTKDPNRLEPRRQNVAETESSTSAPVSAPSVTTKKEADGKWKVDTSYIGYRTRDCDNLNRKDDGKKDENAFADPAVKKYPYEELKGAGSRPPDVDPVRKEQYLSEEEFLQVLGMAIQDFEKLPKWKQKNLKTAKELF